MHTQILQLLHAAHSFSKRLRACKTLLLGTSLLLFLLTAAFSQYATAQNVGIGTKNPSKARLEVHGAVGLTSAIFGAEGMGVSVIRDIPGIGFNCYFDNSMKLLKDGTCAMQYYAPSQGMMAWDISLAGYADRTPPSVRRVMAMYYDGSVNIGELSNKPEASLNVERGLGREGTAIFAGTKHRSHFNFDYFENTYIRAGKDNGIVIINDIPGAKVSMWGSVGINTIAPAYTLEIRQNNKGIYLVDPATNIGWEHRVSSSYGWMELFHNATIVGRFNQWGAYSSVSDFRLKKNIENLPTLMQKVMQLRPVRYEMIHSNPVHQKSIGFISQEVKEIFPELVDVNTETVTEDDSLQNIQTIQYSAFAPIAIKAIQEQQIIIENLQRRLDAMEARLSDAKIPLSFC